MEPKDSHHRGRRGPAHRCHRRHNHRRHHERSHPHQSRPSESGVSHIRRAGHAAVHRTQLSGRGGGRHRGDGLRRRQDEQSGVSASSFRGVAPSSVAATSTFCRGHAENCLQNVGFATRSKTATRFTLNADGSPPGRRQCGNHPDQRPSVSPRDAPDAPRCRCGCRSAIPSAAPPAERFDPPCRWPGRAGSRAPLPARRGRIRR